MTHSSNIVTDNPKSNSKSSRGILRFLLLVLMLISLNWIGCALFERPRVVVISADQVETPLTAGQQFTAPTNGVFMTEGRYLRYRKAINDQILKEQTK